MKEVVISLKRHIELHPGQVLEATLAAYRASLLAMAECGAQACPALGPGLQSGLAETQQALASTVTPADIEQADEKVKAQLSEWGRGAAEYYKEKANQVKEIMIVLARTGEVAAERDQRYLSQFGEITNHLEAVADLEDLTSMRQSILRNASQLKTCVDQMTHDAQESVRRLRSEVSGFQERLEQADRLANQDVLTGLPNRRHIESQIEARLADDLPFSLLMIDLDDFKRVNDSHGHLVGDDILKQFSAELRSALRSSDLIARWAGDEFVVVLDCNAGEISGQVERIRKWVFGDYTVRIGGQARKVPISASIGATSSQSGDTLTSLFNRADASMYSAKRTHGKLCPA